MSLVRDGRLVSFAVTPLLLLVLTCFMVPFGGSASAQTSTSTGDARALVDGQPMSPRLMTALIESSEPPYGKPGTQFLADLKNLGGPPLASDGKPIVVYVDADYCPYCAIERWSLVMSLMRFGNFTRLDYMTSSVDDGDYSTVAFSNSSYQSGYVVFQPYDLFDREANTLMTLPPNYSAVFESQGMSSFPFLDFAGEYYVSGALVSPALLGTLNQSQIVASIQAGNSPGSEIKEGANVFTAAICEVTNNEPTSVCGQGSIVALTSSLAPYTASSTEFASSSATTTLATTTNQSASSGYALNGAVASPSGSIPEITYVLRAAAVVLVIIVVVVVFSLTARRRNMRSIGSAQGSPERSAS